MADPIAGTDSSKTTFYEAQINRDLKTTAMGVIYAFLLGWFAVILRFTMMAIAGSQRHEFYGPGAAAGWMGSMFVTFLWALAWLAGGFAFGFLFGIPKVATQAGALQQAQATSEHKLVLPPRLRVNTNLEDISDWLTKILVGASLTQIIKLPEEISRAARYMAGSTDGNASFCAAILLYFGALGLLSGYLLTRLFFARAFSLADSNPNADPE